MGCARAYINLDHATLLCFTDQVWWAGVDANLGGGSKTTSKDCSCSHRNKSLSTIGHLWGRGHQSDGSGSCAGGQRKQAFFWFCQLNSVWFEARSGSNRGHSHTSFRQPGWTQWTLSWNIRSKCEQDYFFWKLSIIHKMQETISYLFYLELKCKKGIFNCSLNLTCQGRLPNFLILLFKIWDQLIIFSVLT